MEAVQNFDKDWDIALSMVKPGFTLYGDLSKLEIMPQDVAKAQKERQVKIIQRGCSQVACIIGSELSKMSLNKHLKDQEWRKLSNIAILKVRRLNGWLEAISQKSVYFNYNYRQLNEVL